MGRGFHQKRSTRVGTIVGQNRKPKLSVSTGKRTGHVPLTVPPAPKLPQELSEIPKYIKASRFMGAREGYSFSKGKGGLGYYLDRVQIANMGDKARARLAASVAPTPTASPKSPTALGKAKLSATGSKIGSDKSKGRIKTDSSEHERSQEVAGGVRDSGDVSKVRLEGKGRTSNAVNSVQQRKVEGGKDSKERKVNRVHEEEDDEGDESDEGEEEEDGEGREEDGSGDEEEDEADEVESAGRDRDGLASRRHGTRVPKPAQSNGTHTNGTTADNHDDGDQDGVGSRGTGGDDGDGTEEDGEDEEGDDASETGDGDEVDMLSASSGDDDDDDDDEDGIDESKEADSPAQAKRDENELEDQDGSQAKKSRNADTEQEEQDDEKVTFEALGVTEPLCEACAQMRWTHATEIQRQALPLAFKGKDVIGLAETGSGKTGAFAIPILQALLENPQRLFAVILAPTRELAFQINEVMEALGVAIGLKTVCIVGGIDMFQQSVALALKPHVVIATPGRLVDHLENTKGFSLRTVKFLVLDEADRMLGMDFEEEINKVLAVLPRERRTFLFSATMTSKVAKLQRASLKNPARVEVAHKFATPKKLVQQYLFFPAKHKDCYLAYVLNEFAGQSTIVFVATCNGAQRVALLLRNLGFQAVCLHGQMSQPKRLGALAKFKSGQRNVLIATDVASRGLDIPSVDLVVNMEIPSHGKDYIHRVGRTARAGRAGRSIAFVTQYDVEVFQRMEALIGQKLPAYPCDEETVLVLQERVNEAQRLAVREMREAQINKKGKRKGASEDGGEDAETVVRSFKRNRMGGGGGGHGKRGGKRGSGGRR